jgi:hypothetical protein
MQNTAPGLKIEKPFTYVIRALAGTIKHHSMDHGRKQQVWRPKVGTLLALKNGLGKKTT